MRSRLSAYLTTAVAAAALAGCGSSSSSHTKKPPSAAETAETQVTTIWTQFFDGKTPAATKVSLLQNGPQFAQVIDALAKSPLALQSAAKVSDVKLTGITTAKVIYTVLLAGKPVLKDTTGSSVKIGGSWKVSDASFCQLLKLEGSSPAGCPKG